MNLKIVHDVKVDFWYAHLGVSDETFWKIHKVVIDLFTESLNDSIRYPYIVVKLSTMYKDAEFCVALIHFEKCNSIDGYYEAGMLKYELTKLTKSVAH